MRSFCSSGFSFLTKCSSLSPTKVKRRHFEAAMEKERPCLDYFCLGQCLFQFRAVHCVERELIRVLQNELSLPRAD